MNYRQALAYLDEHINLEATKAGPTAGAVHGLSLERMLGVVDVLGAPQASAPVIHVTGTNGKGSVVRLVTALLGAHGLTAGTYTSPHLESITERIRRNIEPISDEDFAATMSEIASVESLFPDRPSYFDLLTAAAFAWFAAEAVEVMVLEVGMLGRFDSTNVARADVAVITNVGRDHTDGRGDWRRAIAEEKAGIIESDSAVIIGETSPDLVDVFRSEGGALHLVRDEHFGVEDSRVAVGGRVVDLYTDRSRLRDVYLPLHGAHQADNAAVAVAATEAFFGRPLDREVVEEAFRSVVAPGRFEVVSHQPLVVVDVAHNPDGMATVARTLSEEFTVDGALTVIVGLLGGRDPHTTLAPLLDLMPAEVVCVRADSPRAMPASDVAVAIEEMARTRPSAPLIRVADDLDRAVAEAVERAGETGAVLICGSTYVAGEARGTLRRLGMVTTDGSGNAPGN